MHIKDFDDVYFEKERASLDEKIIDLPALKVIATDISEDAINISKINAGAAGVENYIEFSKCNFEETPIPENMNGIVFFNPEYGERMGEETQLEETYAGIGDFMKKNVKDILAMFLRATLLWRKK
ncbi:MAG: hypothetical protein WKF59_01920 [Chitinophagaceae bacterium]